jgi:hypothetical protein
MEIKSTYVTFEQAKLLKEKGFNYRVYKEYTPQFDFITDTDTSANCVIGGECAMKYAAEDSFAAPEQWQVVEWLRVNHGIWIQIEFGKDEDQIWFDWYIYKLELGYDYSNESSYSGFNSPQEATSAAINYVLNNLI